MLRVAKFYLQFAAVQLCLLPCACPFLSPSLSLSFASRCSPRMFSEARTDRIIASKFSNTLASYKHNLMHAQTTWFLPHPG